MIDLRKLHEAATPAPWEVVPSDNPSWTRVGVGDNYHPILVQWNPLTNINPDADAALIAATRNALEHLLDAIEGARAAVRGFDAYNDDESGYDQLGEGILKARRGLAALDAHLRGEK